MVVSDVCNMIGSATGLVKVLSCYICGMLDLPSAVKVFPWRGSAGNLFSFKLTRAFEDDGFSTEFVLPFVSVHFSAGV